MKNGKRKNNRVKKKSTFELLRGKEVTLQLLRGHVVTGTFAGSEDSYYILSDVTIRGYKYVCKTPLCLIQKGQVQHMHLKGEITPISES